MRRACTAAARVTPPQPRPLLRRGGDCARASAAAPPRPHPAHTRHVSACIMQHARRGATRLAARPRRRRVVAPFALLDGKRVGPFGLVALELHVRVHPRRRPRLQLQRRPLVHRHRAARLLHRRKPRSAAAAALCGNDAREGRTASWRCSSVGSSRPMPVLCTNKMGTPVTCRRHSVSAALYCSEPHAPCAAFRAAFRPACPRRSALRWRGPRRRRCSPRRSPAAPSRQTSRQARARLAPSLRADARQLPARRRSRACAPRVHAPA